MCSLRIVFFWDGGSTSYHLAYSQALGSIINHALMDIREVQQRQSERPILEMVATGANESYGEF